MSEEKNAEEARSAPGSRYRPEHLASLTERPLSLGLDLSTQSLTAVIIDPEEGKIIYKSSLSYADDRRLNGCGIRRDTFLIPPRREGEADQPPELFLTALDALFSDMATAGLDMERIAVVNISAQQHGHVYLGSGFSEALSDLESFSVSAGQGLAAQLADVFSYKTAPIWMTGDTEEEAAFIREGAGGKEAMIRLSGSDSPLRFTGAVVRRTARRFPEEYKKTERILLLNTFLAAVLSGRADVPGDYGNSSGMSLMNYREKQWDPDLMEAAAGDLPGGTVGLEQKLADPDEPFRAVGTITGYFRERYGFSKRCLVAAGSGDNPQTKVLVPGDLLSLGTSFVNMVATDGETVDLNGYANAMYDGLGRPFMFGCRTNGALVWDRVRKLHGLEREEYGPAEEALAKTSPGESLVLWQPARESFPDSPAFELVRKSGGSESDSIGSSERNGSSGITDPDDSLSELARDYSGIIDSSLGLLYYYSRGFSSATGESSGSTPLYVTGGPIESEEILRRIAGLWNREVITIGKVGAALGAAAAGLETLAEEGYDIPVEETIRRVLPLEKRIDPAAEYVQAYHGKEGYLGRLIRAFERQVRS